MSTEINIKKKLAILNEGVNVTTDASSIDFVGSGVNSSTVGNNVTVTIPGNSGNTTYYLNYSVPVGSYSEFSSIPTSAAEQVIPWTVDPGVTEVAFQFETQVGVPNTTQIPAGLWQFFLHFNALGPNESWIIRPTVYKIDISNVETLLFTADPEVVTNMPIFTTMYTCDGVFPATTLLATDRLLVKISLENIGFNTQSLNFVTEGSQHYSVVFTTLNQVVPTGAVTSVTGTAPIVSSGGTTPAISIPQATGSVNGYLTSSDWSVFNGKQNAITLTTTGTSGAATLVGSTLNVPNYATSTGGIWGIANSSGVYTYYATWALAVAAAVSGQCIELFADITETTSTYILKNGVNVNGNGHTITFSNSLNGFDDNNIACTVVFSNITLVKTQNLAYAVIQCFNASSNVGGYNTVINVANASGYGFYGSGTIWGFTIIGQSYFILVKYATTLIVNNCYINGSGGLSLNELSSFNNSYIKSSVTISGLSNVYNSIIISTGGVCWGGTNIRLVNSTFISMTSQTVQLSYSSGSSVVDNCYIYSAGASPTNVSDNVEFNNCYIEGAISYINAYGRPGGKFYNCTLKSKTTELFYACTDPKLYNCTLINEWNSASGRITNGCTNVVMINNYISVANSSAFVNYATSATNIYMYGNAIKGTSNINSAVITNLQTNTADAQGNVILQ